LCLESIDSGLVKFFLWISLVFFVPPFHTHYSLLSDLIIPQWSLGLWSHGAYFPISSDLVWFLKINNCLSWRFAAACNAGFSLRSPYNLLESLPIAKRMCSRIRYIASAYAPSKPSQSRC
jgi:hypothetical protein